MVGYAFYRGEILRDDDGLPVPGNWEPLLDEETWYQVIERLTPNRAYPKRTKKGFLSKLARCGNCMTGMVRYGKSETRFSYGCPSKERGGCAGVFISGPKLDEQVTELILTYLDSREIVPEPDNVRDSTKLIEIARQKTELMGEYRAGRLPISLVVETVKSLEAEEQVLQAATNAAVRRKRHTTTTRQEWPLLPLPARQMIAHELFEAIIIAPSGRTGRYDPDRATVVWKT